MGSKGRAAVPRGDVDRYRTRVDAGWSSQPTDAWVVLFTGVAAFFVFVVFTLVSASPVSTAGLLTYSAGCFAYTLKRWRKNGD